MDRNLRASCVASLFALAIPLVLATGCNRAPQPPQRASTAETSSQPQMLPPVPCAELTEIQACSAIEDGPSLALPNPVTMSAAPPAAVGGQTPAVFAISPEDTASQQPTVVSAAPYASGSAINAPPSFNSPSIEPPIDSSAALPWGPSTPTTEMMAVAQRAELAARRGFNLAERGALYSARSQFIECLKIVAQALDEQLHTGAHTKALAAGLRAVEEVDEFVPRDSRLQTDLNLQMIAAAHRTPVLKSRSLEQLTAADVQRLYLTYAQEQLAAASGDQAVGSLALHGLGKICTTPADMHGPREQIAEAKAVAYYQAALLVEPNNFMAANELGVIFARYGRLKQSQAVLEQAVARSASPAAYRNLAVVCERLGEQEKAAVARREAEASVARLQQSGHKTAGMRYPIEWVDPSVFASNNSMAMASAATAPSSVSSGSAPEKTAAAPAAIPTTATKSKSFWPWVR
jgi:tetratricopeptide (TPR) repeat protein